MFNFEKLKVYEEALILATDVYKLTKSFPKSETFGITSQLRRASVSISLNIAEGTSRTKKDFRHFLDIARGSCYEVVPLLNISLRLKYIQRSEHNDFYSRVDTLAKRLNVLKKSVN